MQVNISGKQLDIGTALQKYAKDNLTKTVEKYFDRAINSVVVFSKDNHNFRADIRVNEGSGIKLIIKSQADSTDIYESYDKALDKIGSQLRRYKKMIRNHHKQNKGYQNIDNHLSGTKYIISPFTEDSDWHQDGKNNAPLIIAEKPTEIEKLTVSEAVMKMDLHGLPAVLFINKGNGRMNVVYHRADGNISWLDPNYQV